MKKCLAIAAAMMCGVAATSQAAAFKVYDFEDCEIGQVFNLWNFYGSEVQSTAVVEADPANPSNKVLHITLKDDWNTYVSFTLAENMAGEKLTDKYDKLSLRMYRHQDDPVGEWKHFDVLVGQDKVYEDDGWPPYGGTGSWSTRTFNLKPASEGNVSDRLSFGFNSDNTDYYIDDVVLKVDYEVMEDGKVDFNNPSSTSNSYSEYDQGINIPEGTKLDVYTSRYSHWMSAVIGAGTMNIYGAGERVYIGTENGASHPDWSGYIGDVHVYPWKEGFSGTAGSYGIVLAHGGKKYSSDDIKGSIADHNYTGMLEDNALIIHDGATVSAQGSTNARAFRIAHLETEKNSTLTGHFKSSDYRIYYIVGRSGKDSELAGKIVPQGNSPVGIVKEGHGTYSITGNENSITGQLSVIGGKVLIDNDAAAAREKKLPGAVGIGANTPGVVVYTGGCVGGTGHISGLTDVYGHIEPGTTYPGTLTIADFAGGKGIDLRVHPTTRMIFKVSSQDAYDCLDVSGAVTLDTRKEDLSTSETMPILEIKLPLGHDLKVGDKFTLLKASGKSGGNEGGWKFRVQYPNEYTWEVTENVTDEGYAVTAKVTSLESAGQGDTIYEDEYGEETVDNEAWLVDYADDYNDTVALRDYAANAGKGIGVAVPVWKFNLSNPSEDARVAAVVSQFNMVVAENEMKIDATEPEQGKFALGDAEALISFARQNSMGVRGHTLVWHSQVPSWISSDGKKNSNKFSREELTEIMRSHINGVAGGLKGKVREWDVVNECLDDDQSVVRNDPTAFKLRPSVWQLGIGNDFVKTAFEMAHEADPDAHLYLNDYGVEFMGQPKAEAFYNLAKSLVEAGAPIYGVGLQCHITVGDLNADRLAANIRRYEELGLKCIITELDIAQANPYAPDAQTRQAKEYCAAVNAALSQPNCPTVMIWGLIDQDSWRGNNPLIYDSSVQPKEAYYAVHAVLRNLAGKSGIETDVMTVAPEVVNVEYFNLHGQSVSPSMAAGVVIKRTFYSDGSVTSEKIVMRK